MTSKLFTLSQATEACMWLRESDLTVVLTNGVFDLLHPGHLHSLKFAKQCGDALFVAVNSDESTRELKGPSRPIQSVQERVHALEQVADVDGIIIFSQKNLAQEILALRPNVYCKSDDYMFDTLNWDERIALNTVHARIAFVSFLPGFSTTSIIANRIANENNVGVPHDF